MPLKRFSYEYIGPVSYEDGSLTRPKEGDLMDLLRDADPYNFLPPKIPPLRVMNSFLSSGSNDLGMGGGAVWEPFELSENEYWELIEYLKSTDGKKRFSYEEPLTILDLPETVRTVADLSAWKIDEALKDPNHHLNSETKNARLADGRMVTFKEFWEHEKAYRRKSRSAD